VESVRASIADPRRGADTTTLCSAATRRASRGGNICSIFASARTRLMPPLLLDDDEAVAVRWGCVGAAGVIQGVEEASVRALAKIEQILPPRLARRVAALQSVVVSAPRRGSAIDARTLSTIGGVPGMRDTADAVSGSLRRGVDAVGGAASSGEYRASGGIWWRGIAAVQTGERFVWTGFRPACRPVRGSCRGNRRRRTLRRTWRAGMVGATVRARVKLFAPAEVVPNGCRRGLECWKLRTTAVACWIRALPLTRRSQCTLCCWARISK